MKLVEITWLDAACEHEHMDITQAKKIHPMKRMNVGYLVESNEEKVIICFGQLEDMDKELTVVDTTLVVPAGDVLTQRILGDISGTQ